MDEEERRGVVGDWTKRGLEELGIWEEEGRVAERIKTKGGRREDMNAEGSG